MLADKSIEWVRLWYNNLDYGVQETINKIFVLFINGNIDFACLETEH